jgi:hypothetical protein
MARSTGNVRIVPDRARFADHVRAVSDRELPSLEVPILQAPTGNEIEYVKAISRNAKNEFMIFPRDSPRLA